MSDRRNMLMTILRLALASLVIGLLLSFLDITPVDLLQKTSSLVLGAWDFISGTLGWAGSYMLLGALVVVPLWLLALLWKRLKGGEP